MMQMLGWLVLVLGAASSELGTGQPEAAWGVAVPFIFDPHTTCCPACHYSSLCICNSTCFYAMGYEGQLCQ